jgi:hypothetical protein
MDWTLTGALAGVAILATTVGYEFVVITRSNPEPAKKYEATAVLIPARERPVISTHTLSSASELAYTPAPAPQTHAPSVAYAPAPQTHAPSVAYAPAPQTHAPSVAYAPAPPTHAPAAVTAPAPQTSSAHNEVKPPPKPQPQVNSDSWQVQTTAKANYYNLGGHVDRNGIVDSLASGYLSEALKKHKNFPKLPAQIQAHINAPNVNLAKIAGYRGLLGIDDREMEDKQGIKFIRVASTRGIEITDPGDADLDASPIDLGSLERMAFDLRQSTTPGVVP